MVPVEADQFPSVQNYHIITIHCTILSTVEGEVGRCLQYRLTSTEHTDSQYKRNLINMSHLLEYVNISEWLNLLFDNCENCV